MGFMGLWDPKWLWSERKTIPKNGPEILHSGKRTAGGPQNDGPWKAGNGNFWYLS